MTDDKKVCKYCEYYRNIYGFGQCYGQKDAPKVDEDACCKDFKFRQDLVIMKQITNKEYEKYQEYKRNEYNCMTITPKGLALICKGNNMSAPEIGEHMLSIYAMFKAEGLCD